MPAAPPPLALAPDSFKGTFRAAEVAAALERGLDATGWTSDRCPVADGGEGTMEVLLLALGGETAAADVHDPLPARGFDQHLLAVVGPAARKAVAPAGA